MDIDNLHAALAIATSINENTIWRWLAGSRKTQAGNRQALEYWRERIEREHAEGLARAAGCERAPHEPEDEVSQ